VPAMEMGQEMSRTLAPQSKSGLLHLLSFQVGNEEYAMDAENVREIIGMRNLTHVPNFPPYIEGVTELREKVVPVVGLRKRFGLESGERGRAARIIVAEVEGDVVGFEVDSVAGVVRIPVNTIEPLPRLRVPDSAYVSAVSRQETRLLLLVDVNRLLVDTETSLTSRKCDPVAIELDEGVLVS